MKDQEGNYIRCDCGKICYTFDEAGFFLNNLKKKDRKTQRIRSKHDYIPKRKYRCDICGYWHVTHYKTKKRGNKND